MKHMSIHEANSEDVRPIIEAIDWLVLTKELDFGPPGMFSDLLPRKKISKLAVRRDYNREPPETCIATVIRHTPMPDLGPEAYKSDVFRIDHNPEGLFSIRQSMEVYTSPVEESEPTDLMDALDFEKTHGFDRVSPEDCLVLARQIGSTVPLL
jgi:hypothetical protein